MNKAQQKRFDTLYRKHLNALRRQGMAESTIDLYARAIMCCQKCFGGHATMAFYMVMPRNCLESYSGCFA